MSIIYALIDGHMTTALDHVYAHLKPDTLPARAHAAVGEAQDMVRQSGVELYSRIQNLKDKRDDCALYLSNRSMETHEQAERLLRMWERNHSCFC